MTQGRFDGMTVDFNHGKFAGSFEIPEDVGVSYDTTYAFVVTAVAGKSTFGSTKSGDIERTTAFDLFDVQVYAAEEALEILGKASLPAKSEVPGQMSVDDYDEDAF